ncbi:MAG: hypothetical protein ACD_79C00337G0002 [uncultured bacterium]|nr:MAG: hypothetical protein ACD_79C00337G0002 [uncultured bacterium]
MKKIITALLLFSIVGCSSTKEKPQNIEKQGITDSEILIGTSSALSGDASYLGFNYNFGAMAYINEVNSNGGVCGRKIKLISYDDAYEPIKAVSNTLELINKDKVFLLFNYVGTSTLAAVIDLINEAKIPAIGFFTGAEILRIPFSRYIFHVRSSYAKEAENIINHIVDIRHLKNIACFYQSDEFGISVLSAVQSELKKRNMELSATGVYKRNTVDVEEGFKFINSSKPEAIIMVGIYSPLAKFISLFNNEEYIPYFYSGSFIGSDPFAKELIEKYNIRKEIKDKILVNQVIPCPYDPEEMALVSEYTILINKYFPEIKPNYVGFEGFINAKVLVHGLTKIGYNLSREIFIRTLESLKDYDIGFGGNITYSSEDHEGLSETYFSSLQGNVFEDCHNKEEK